MARRPLIDRHVRERFLVTLTDETAFDGLVYDRDAEHIVLANTYTVPADGSDGTPVDGHLWLPRSRIAYMQQSHPRH